MTAGAKAAAFAVACVLLAACVAIVLGVTA